MIVSLLKPYIYMCQFFLTMWDELQKRQTEPDTNGMIFDEVVAAYEKLRNRMEELIVEEVLQIYIDKSWEYDRKYVFGAFFMTG